MVLSLGQEMSSSLFIVVKSKNEVNIAIQAEYVDVSLLIHETLCSPPLLTLRGMETQKQLHVKLCL